MSQGTKIQTLVEGGKATPGPPLAPALGPLGINVRAVVDAINEKTANFEGIRVPVTIEVAEDKSYTISVGTPPTSALLVAELGGEKGSETPGSETIGDLSLDRCIKIARMKEPDMLAKSIRNATQEVLGTCISAGITVDGKDPRSVQQEIRDGIHDEIFT